MMYSILYHIRKKVIYCIPNKILIFILNNRTNTFANIFLYITGHRSLANRLNKNGLIIKKIIEIEISDLYVLRNIKCECIESKSKDFLPFLERFKSIKGDLKLMNSFHLKLFNKFKDLKNFQSLNYKNLNYYKWHQDLHKNKINRRDHNWILNKLESCFHLYKSILLKGFVNDNNKNLPLILNKPLIKSRYQFKYKIDGFEIFDGHHRVACLASLGYKKVECFLCLDIADKTPFGINLNEINK